MFDIGATELLMIVIVAVIVIGPKDLPMALRTAGRWVGKMRKMSSQFRAGFDAMVREAEMEEMQKSWDKRNAEIMAKHPDADAETGQLAQPAPEPPASELPAPAAPQNDDPAMEPLPLFEDEAGADAKPDKS